MSQSTAVVCSQAPCGVSARARIAVRGGAAGHSCCRVLASVLAAVAGVATFLLTPGQPTEAGAQLTVPTISTPQLLHNPGFQQGFTGWSATPGENLAIYTRGAAQDDHYLETNAGSGGVGSGIYQDVPISPAVGHSYRATVMLRNRSNGPIGVGLVLWALGGSAQPQGQTTGIALRGHAWKRYSVELDITNSGYTDLRLQLYFATPGPNMDVDAADLQDAGLVNASFEQGLNGWGLTPGANAAIYQGSAYEDASYLETNTGSAGTGASLYQDVSTEPTVDHGYAGALMLRSPTGQPVHVQLVLWAFGGPSAAEVGVTNVTVSSTSWQSSGVALTVRKPGFTDLRLQLYLYSAGENVDVDAASLTDTGLSNPGFGAGIAGWGYSANMNLAVYGGSSYEGPSYLEMNTGGAGSGASIATAASGPVPDGNSYVGAVELRSPTGRRIKVHIFLATRGRQPRQLAQTTAIVTSRSWTEYTVGLDVTNPGYTGFTLRVGVSTVGANLDVGAADVQMPHDSPITTGGQSCTPNNSCSPQTFAEAMLAEPAVQGPATSANLFALETWFRAEGGGAGCPAQPPYSSPWSYSGGPAGNPLNTIQWDPGAQPTPWNSIGVQQFENADGQTCWYWGLFAEYKALTNGYYPPIISALQHPAAGLLQQCDNLAQAVGSTPWGTGDFSRDC